MISEMLNKWELNIIFNGLFRTKFRNLKNIMGKNGFLLV